jgi:FAD/FMN-containing dehydrogenase
MLSPVQIYKYYDQRQSYWADQQRDLSPACFVLPTSSQEVAVALKTLSQAQCPFALRSGGHSPNQGFNNLQAGVTFDLSNLAGVDVAADRSFVNIKPGSRWCMY